MPTRKGAPVRERTWHTNQERILHFLGWLKNEIGFDISDLDIALMADMTNLDEFLTWQLTTRGNGYAYGVSFCAAAANVAKWLYGKDSKRAKYRDCDPVLDIRDAQAQLALGIEEDRRTTSTEAFSEKLLDLSACEEIVAYLRECCSERTACGTQRSTRAIIKAWQNYLIIAGLTYTPVRQFEFTILELEKNLKRELDGWWVTLAVDEHKTGSKTKKGREYPLFSGAMKEQLTRDLDEYVNRIRPLANPQHNFLFFQRGNHRSPQSSGRPISDSVHLSGLVPRVMLRASALLFGEENAKRTSPHDFRRIFCTWLYTYGNAEEQEVYAEVMGHSVEQAHLTYVLLKSRDKTVKVDDSRRSIDERSIQMKAQHPRWIA